MVGEGEGGVAEGKCKEVEGRKGRGGGGGFMNWDLGKMKELGLGMTNRLNM